MCVWREWEEWGGAGVGQCVCGGGGGGRDECAAPLTTMLSYELRNMKTCLSRAYADSEGSDQPAHPHCLTSVFAVRLKNHWIL